MGRNYTAQQILSGSSLVVGIVMVCLMVEVIFGTTIALLWLKLGVLGLALLGLIVLGVMGQNAARAIDQRLEQQKQDLQQAQEDLQASQSQLIQAEKMASLGHMVAGVAHEIVNPINFIHGNLAFAQDYAKELLDLVEFLQTLDGQLTPELWSKLEAIDLEFLKSDFPEVLNSMSMGTDRIYKIVCSVRNFSRLEELDIKAVDIHQGIEDTLLILNHRLKYGFQVIRNYGNLPLIPCYPVQLNQVFMNIIANAIDAMEQANCSTRHIFIQTETQADHQVKITITDSGPGIPPEIQAKIFDPFFTTKPIGKGTGLGLGICAQIIEKHRGKIEVYSTMGEGTKFVVTLPITSA